MAIEYILGSALLLIKHFLMEGPLQTEYQYKNKAEWGHLGGILHASLHLIGTFIAFFLLCIFMKQSLSYALALSSFLALIDGGIHYCIDLTKERISKTRGWAKFEKKQKDNNTIPVLTIYDDKFFFILIADQCLHFFTYVCLLTLCLKFIL